MNVKWAGRAVVGSGALALGAVLLWFVATPRSPEAALAAFYAQENDGRTAEDQLIDPLVLAGDRVVPLVARDVVHRDMRLRRYGISFLGQTRSLQASKVLSSILEDESEQDLFRGDALEALWAMRVPERDALARGFANRLDYLGDAARRLLRGEEPVRRTYWQALVRAHD